MCTCIAYLSYFLHFLHCDENALLHQCSTQQKDDFHVYTVQSEIGKKAIKFKGSKLWNNLPTNIKEIQSHSSFKYKLNDYLLQSLE